MADDFFKISKGVSLTPRVSASNPSDGDMYYDSSRNTFVYRNNGNLTDFQSRTDVASAASYTSTNFTSSVVRSSAARLTGSTAGSLHGMVASSDAKMLFLYNDSSVNQTIKHQSITEGTPANRIITSSGTDVVLGTGESALFMYDSSQARWILVLYVSTVITAKTLRTHDFTSSGTLTLEADVSDVEVEIISGGGGGGTGKGGEASGGSGGSGGAGATPYTYKRVVTPSDVLTVNIGAGGTGGVGNIGTGNNGGSGGASEIIGTGLYIHLPGASGGNRGTSTGAGTFGVSQSSYSENIAGLFDFTGPSGDGQDNSNPTVPGSSAAKTVYFYGTPAAGGNGSAGGTNRGQPGGGGGSGLGAGGKGGNGSILGNTTSSQPGDNALSTNYGAGGGGGAGNISGGGSAGKSGGNGAPGFIRITYWSAL